MIEYLYPIGKVCLLIRHGKLYVLFEPVRKLRKPEPVCAGNAINARLIEIRAKINYENICKSITCSHVIG